MTLFLLYSHDHLNWGRFMANPMYKIIQKTTTVLLHVFYVLLLWAKLRELNVMMMMTMLTVNAT